MTTQIKCFNTTKAEFVYLASLYLRLAIHSYLKLHVKDVETKFDNKSTNKSGSIEILTVKVWLRSTIEQFGKN